MKKVLLTTVMSLMMCMGVFAQDYMNAPKQCEKVLGSISVSKTAPWTEPLTYEHTSNIAIKQRWYETLLEKAKKEYPNKVIDIRNMEMGARVSRWLYEEDGFYGPATGKIVWIMSKEDIANEFNKTLSQALNKALRNVREGSRMAIDQVLVPYTMEKENLKDQLLDLLLDKGYKVIAKDYLDKLYEEQQAQQSGIYNDNTTVQDNNFSAVGYYINVKVTETSLRVQVVNVSTGEYEGNATVNF